MEQMIRVALVAAAFALVFQPQPTPHSPAHKPLHANESVAAVAEVEAGWPAFEFAIDAFNRFVLGDVKCPMVEDGPEVVPQFLTAFGVWLDVGAGASRAPALGHVGAKTQKLEAVLPNIQQARFGFVEL